MDISVGIGRIQGMKERVLRVQPSRGHPPVLHMQQDLDLECQFLMTSNRVGGANIPEPPIRADKKITVILSSFLPSPADPSSEWADLQRHFSKSTSRSLHLSCP